MARYSTIRCIGSLPVCLVLSWAPLAQGQDLPTVVEAPPRAMVLSVELADQDEPVAGDRNAPPTERAIAPSDSTKEGIEVINERYPSGAVKNRREVTQDEKGNYILHGEWKQWDEQGTLTAEGQYRNHERHGVWNRWYRGHEAPLFSTQPYREFQAPFVSQANFEDGKLNGKWTIHDSKQRKISEIAFVHGLRHGTATWWHPNGRKMRQVTYREGLVDGEWLRWAPDAQVLVQDTYQSGRKLAPKVETYPSGKQKSKGMYLHAKRALQTPDDWWNATPAQYTPQGKDKRHGAWVAWHPNGQMETQGEYQDDLQVGEFTWWYPSGQKRVLGSYNNGKQHGTWTWWHANGQKATDGHFSHGEPTGQWFWWKETGQLAQKADFSQSADVVSVKDFEHGEASMQLGPALGSSLNR